MARGIEDLRSLLLGFDVDPHDEDRVLKDYFAARAGAAVGGPVGPTAELEPDRGLRRPRRTGRRPAGQRRAIGRADDTDSHLHSAHEHFHTYLQQPRRRAGRPAGVVPGHADQGPRPLRRRRPGAHPGAGSGGVPHLPGHARARPSTPPSSRPLLRGWLSDPLPPEADARAGRAGAGAADRRHPDPLPPRRRPGARRGVRAGSASRCCAATGPASTPASASHLRYLDEHPQAAGPRRAHRRDGAQHRAAGAAARPAPGAARTGQRGHARGPDPALLRQQGPDRRPTRRAPAGAPSWSPSATARALAVGGGAGRAARRRPGRPGRAGRRRRRLWTPTSTCAGRTSPTPTRPRTVLQDVISAPPAAGARCAG